MVPGILYMHEEELNIKLHH